MLFGVYMFAADYAIRIDELAQAVEERGFESLFIPEHTHLPTSRRTPFFAGGELPREYRHTLDPFVALATAAAVTTTLKVGTGICLIVQRDPIITAKEVASLDLLSGGRFLFGIGGGWNAEEMENHGTSFTTRFRLLRERVLAMKAIWTKDEAEFHGQYVAFGPIWSYPKPVQRPHPPVLLGGESRHTIRRVVEFCDGWFPRGSREFDAAQSVAALRREAERVGRDPSSISISVFGTKPDDKVINRFRSAGITRTIFSLPSADRETVLPLLDQYAKLTD